MHLINKDVRTRNDDAVAEENPLITPDKLNDKIDSILHTFGIDNSWITTQTGKHKDKNVLFEKNVIIPLDVSTVELNLEISSIIKSTGFSHTVTEDIITKDIFINIENNDTGKESKTIAKITVRHSDKLSRNGSTICLIIEGLEELSENEIEKIIKNKTEFSYVLPRNPENINIRQKLIAMKKDITLKLTAKDEENYGSDFSSNSDEKKIRETVKNLTGNYPNIRNVLLISETAVKRETLNNIYTEFSKYNIKVISDTALTLLLTQEEEKSPDKPNILAEKIKFTSNHKKLFISLIKLDIEQFQKIYDEILVLKKRGHKFCNLSEYLSKAEENKTNKEPDKLNGNNIKSSGNKSDKLIERKPLNTLK